MTLAAARHTARRRERGQILVIVAFGLIGLLSLAGLALEGGTLVLNRRYAQNASDLAAVAGARVLALNYTDGGRTGGEVLAALDASMAVNDCSTPAQCTWTAEFVGSGLTSRGVVSGGGIPSGARGVRVMVTRTPGAVLGRILGFDTWTVTTEGTAIATKPSSVAGGLMLPIAMCGWTNPTSNECARAENSPSNAIDLEPGQIYDLTAGKNAPGGFGWLSWGGGPLSTSICTPNNPAITLDGPFDDPDSGGELWFRGATGSTRVADVSTCLFQWIANRTTVLIPIYDVLDEDEREFHITGVAAFVLTSLGSPAEDTIQGYFVEYVPFAGNPTAATLQPDAGDTTVFIGLVK